MPKQKQKQTREAIRYASLARQIQDIRGYSLRATALLLDISHSQLIRLTGGEREGIGAELVNRARERVGVDPAYFFDDYEGEADYRTYIEPLYENLRMLLTRDFDIDTCTPEIFNEIVTHLIDSAEMVNRWLGRDIARMNAIKEASIRNKRAKEQYIKLLSQDRTGIYQNILDNSNDGLKISILISKVRIENSGGERRIEPNIVKTVSKNLRFSQRLIERILCLISDDPDLGNADFFPPNHPILHYFRSKKKK